MLSTYQPEHIGYAVGFAAGKVFLLLNPLGSPEEAAEFAQVWGIAILAALLDDPNFLTVADG